MSVASRKSVPPCFVSVEKWLLRKKTASSFSLTTRCSCGPIR